jgi:hypothetical protein
VQLGAARSSAKILKFNLKNVFSKFHLLLLPDAKNHPFPAAAAIPKSLNRKLVLENELVQYQQGTEHELTLLLQSLLQESTNCRSL